MLPSEPHLTSLKGIDLKEIDVGEPTGQNKGATSQISSASPSKKRILQLLAKN